MAKITPRKKKETVTVSTGTAKKANRGYKWWDAKTKDEAGRQLIATAAYLKERQQGRYRQDAVLSRLYGNMPLFNFVGSSYNRNIQGSLPIDRPTMNVIQSCVDTLVSRISQAKPRPMFLTDNGDYKERNLAKQFNTFIMGEFYRNKAYKLGELALRDAAVRGTGIIKIFENPSEKRVALERVFAPELLVDFNESKYGAPRRLYQFKLVDREVLKDMFPNHKSDIAQAEQGYQDNSADSSDSVSDQVIVVEGWSLPSGKDAGDGRHMIACSSGIIFDEEWTKSKFPFVFLPYCEPLEGFWGQALAEQLMGTQTEINKLLIQISKSINLVGVPRVFVEDGSKVVKAHLNNEIGSIVTYRGTKPVYEVAPCVPQETYAQLQRLIEYAYQQSGVSALAATAQKPAGLNSGEAIRNYDDLQSDRFASLNKRYDNFYIDLAYQIMDVVSDIVKRDETYSTVYPDKNGTKEIQLDKVHFLKDTFTIQCFDSSSLPRDPAGRLQAIVERIQSGMYSMQEGRRLLADPDIEQVDKLLNASEERILKILDQIVEEGVYTPPDPFMDLDKASELVVQYYNLYVGAKLEEERAEMLRSFKSQVDSMQQVALQAMQPAMPPQGPVQAMPEARPTSPLLPNVPQGV
jgi:hypothetical protein